MNGQTKQKIIKLEVRKDRDVVLGLLALFACLESTAKRTPSPVTVQKHPR